ncbi:MAG: ABC transporter permease, partial [Anaerolineae bacterium]|nr:ABC transporter permease [Anaerolineae bacterium]
LATVVRSPGQASALSTFLGLTLAALGGAWWSLELPFIPQIMRTISLFSPVTYAMNGFNQLLYYRGTLVDVIVPVGILLVVSAVFFFFGIRNFKYE